MANIFGAIRDAFSGTEEELLQYCLARRLEVCSRYRFDKGLRGESSEFVAKELKSLIIYAIIQVSQGQLLEGLSGKQAFILNTMPDIEADSILNRYQGVAALMYQQEGNLIDIADKVKIPLSDVCDFYNVCYLLGYIEVIGAKPKILETSNSNTLGQHIK